MPPCTAKTQSAGGNVYGHTRQAAVRMPDPEAWPLALNQRHYGCMVVDDARGCFPLLSDTTTQRRVPGCNMPLYCMGNGQGQDWKLCSGLQSPGRVLKPSTIARGQGGDWRRSLSSSAA